MEVVLNGDPRTLDDGSTVADLLDLLDLARRRVAVEINAEIVEKSAYSARVLAAGDRIEIVQFVGGG